VFFLFLFFVTLILSASFRNFVEINTPEPSQVPTSKPWQHKTIGELIHDRKHKTNRQR